MEIPMVSPRKGEAMVTTRTTLILMERSERRKKVLSLQGEARGRQSEGTHQQAVDFNC